MTLAPIRELIFTVVELSIWKEATLLNKGTVPDLRAEQSEVVESGQPLAIGHFPDENYQWSCLQSWRSFRNGNKDIRQD